MPVKLEWLGYRIVEKLWRYVKPFSYNTSVSRTDRRTDRITISISHVSSSMLTRDKNVNLFGNFSSKWIGLHTIDWSTKTLHTLEQFLTVWLTSCSSINSLCTVYTKNSQNIYNIHVCGKFQFFLLILLIDWKCVSWVAYAPGTIAVNVTWIEREFNACQTPRSMYPSIFNHFWDIKVASDWFSTLLVVSEWAFLPHIVFPWVRPWDNRGKFTWIEREFNGGQTPRSMYPSIFNRFPVIQASSLKVRHFSTFLHILASPEYAPGTIAVNVTYKYKYKYKWEFVERGLQIVQGR